MAELHALGGVDVVLTPLWGCEGLVCLLDDRFPTVVSCMTSMATIQELRGDGEPDAEAAALIALERPLIGRARYLHGLTRGVLDATLAQHGARPELAEVVGRGLADRAAGSGAADRRAPPGPPLVLFVGRLERRKGVAVLLDAARRLERDGVDFSLVLAGPDSADTETGEPYRAAFERDAALAGRVRFAGAVSDDELDELYRRADVVCLPSTYESHGVVAVEAMMFGKPIAACAGGGLSEVLEPGGNALVVAPGDAPALARELRRLIEDGDLRRRVGSRSRSLYEERFEAGAAAAAMERLLRMVVDAHEPRETTSDELRDRLASVVAELRLAVDAGRLAAELLDPPAEAWRASAIAAERDAAAWQARATEAERQRAAAVAELASVASSRWWRLTRPLRRATQALRRP